MQRKITGKLIAWKDNPKRMPLIVNGARQVGKTYILKEFGVQNFNQVVHINLETNLLANSYFETDITPLRILQFLETVSNTRIIAGETLVILDEIQSCSRALASLKTFCEDAPQYHIVAAGSLLGVAVNKDQFSFPVGKVDELFMFPMDFEEFLWAMDKELLSKEISIHFASLEAMPEVLHKQAMEMYKQYLIVGGMPAAVAEFVETKSLLSSSEIQGHILNQYIADMAKYASPATSVKIRACYNSIPTQLAKENRKFQYKIVQKGGTATLFGESIEWLNSAGIILKCQKIKHGFMPIAAYTDLSDFKLYMSDIGMLTMKSGMAQQTILSPKEEENEFVGVMSENYVAQALTCNGFPLYYWKNENTAELDFVLQIEGQVIPVEVKKGLRTKSVSMTMFVKKYNSPYSIRISGKNFGFDNKIKAIPLYAVFCIKTS
ncbi:MAG: ATP-binding protein [Bacteroidales bacterium]|jgi:predicted AAA+ superfamily ATPase|nr:ATP-binding protein [Bacteroidales bacterium]